MAKDKYVAVTFDPAGTPQFKFSTLVVPMKSAGKIIWFRAPEAAKWTFQSINLLPANWKQDVTDEDITVHDPHNPTGTYKYTITVKLDDKEYTSPADRIEFDEPPIIKNEV